MVCKLLMRSARLAGMGIFTLTISGGCGLSAYKGMGDEMTKLVEIFDVIVL